MNFREFLDFVEYSTGRAAESPYKPGSPQTGPIGKTDPKKGAKTIPPSKFNVSDKLQANLNRQRSPLSPGTEPLTNPPPSPFNLGTKRPQPVTSFRPSGPNPNIKVPAPNTNLG